MPNMTILQANVAAALNQTSLSSGDKQRMDQYAQLTAPGYCAGCADICESAIDYDIPISDLMRLAMYDHSYSDRKTASRMFNALPSDLKENILKADYRKAETCCPQNIQIGKILRKTLEDLA